MIEGVIEIRGLRCRGRQGTSDEERAKEQDYLVDVWITADVERAIARDDLAEAIDISAIADAVRASVAERPRPLVERIAGDVGRALLARFPRVVETRVKVTKPNPAGLGADAESVEISLRR